MVLSKRWIPSTSALLAFESAARLRNFSRAAEELKTSQSAISRHIAALEARLGATLFERRKGRQILTAEGKRLLQAVAFALETLQSSTMAIANRPGGGQVTIACSHEISHLFVMPRFEALQRAVGDATQIRIMTYEYETLESAVDPRVDVIFTYDASRNRPQDRVVVFHEAIRPVCAPAIAADYRRILAGDVEHWSDLSFLDLTKHNRGWATWQDWLQRVGATDAKPRYVGFENHVYLLEAAAAGRGLALGWRGLIERYLDAGTLVPLGGDFVEFDRPFYAALVQASGDQTAAKKCLAFFQEDHDR